MHAMLAGGCLKLPKECSNITNKHTYVMSNVRIHVDFTLFFDETKMQYGHWL